MGVTRPCLSDGKMLFTGGGKSPLPVVGNHRLDNIGHTLTGIFIMPKANTRPSLGGSLEQV